MSEQSSVSGVASTRQRLRALLKRKKNPSTRSIPVLNCVVTTESVMDEETVALLKKQQQIEDAIEKVSQKAARDLEAFSKVLQDRLEKTLAEELRQILLQADQNDN